MLQVLASLDVVGKVDALARGLWFAAIGRGAARVTFAPPPSMAPATCEAMLARRGVGVFGRGICPSLYDWGGGHKGTIAYVHCSARQRRWAEYVLTAAGAVVLDPPDLANVQAAAQRDGLPPAWADRGQPSAQAATSGKNAPEKRGKRLLRELW
jgi:hypothetical protein